MIVVGNQLCVSLQKDRINLKKLEDTFHTQECLRLEEMLELTNDYELRASLFTIIAGVNSSCRCVSKLNEQVLSGSAKYVCCIEVRIQ